MTNETTTSLPPSEGLARAKVFFGERVPHQSAFVDCEGPGYVTFRGQGGEELTVAAMEVNGATRVRASTLLFDQTIGRFLATLPEVSGASS